MRREFLDSLDSARPESWFVLHCIYKSEVEYLASLCRGDRCNNSSEPLKQNRWGLRPFPGYPASPFLFQVARDKIKVYRNSYLSFVMASGLLERLKLARRFVVERSSRLAALLQEQPGLMDSFSRCFLGTRYQSATCAGRDQLRNRRSVEFFDASRFYLSRPDVLSAHGHSAPRDEVAYVHALNEFYGFDRSLLSDFTLAEFGYWHTRFFARKYEENGKSADFWMRKNPIP